MLPKAGIRIDQKSETRDQNTMGEVRNPKHRISNKSQTLALTFVLPGNRHRTAKDAKRIKDIFVRTRLCDFVPWWLTPISVLGALSVLTGPSAGLDLQRW
jgi:hypothetical protein